MLAADVIFETEEQELQWKAVEVADVAVRGFFDGFCLCFGSLQIEIGYNLRADPKIYFNLDAHAVSQTETLSFQQRKQKRRPVICGGFHYPSAMVMRQGSNHQIFRN